MEWSAFGFSAKKSEAVLWLHSLTLGDFNDGGANNKRGPKREPKRARAKRGASRATGPAEQPIEPRSQPGKASQGILSVPTFHKRQAMRQPLFGQTPWSTNDVLSRTTPVDVELPKIVRRRRRGEPSAQRAAAAAAMAATATAAGATATPATARAIWGCASWPDVSRKSSARILASRC